MRQPGFGVPTPPRFAAWLVGLCASEQELEALLGDLQEEFTTIAGARGLGIARGWYWRQSLRSAARLASASVIFRPGRTVLMGISAVLLQSVIQTAMLLVLVALLSIGAPYEWIHLVTSSPRQSQHLLPPAAFLYIPASAWLIARYSRLPALSVPLAMAFGSFAAGTLVWLFLVLLLPPEILVAGVITRSPMVNIERMLVMLTLATAGAVLASLTPRLDPLGSPLRLTMTLVAGIQGAGAWIYRHRDYAGNLGEPREP